MLFVQCSMCSIYHAFVLLPFNLQSLLPMCVHWSLPRSNENQTSGLVQDFPEGQSRQIGVQGKADQVLRAVQMINELIQGEPGSAQAIIQKVKRPHAARAGNLVYQIIRMQ